MQPSYTAEKKESPGKRITWYYPTHLATDWAYLFCLKSEIIKTSQIKKTTRG